MEIKTKKDIGLFLGNWGEIMKLLEKVKNETSFSLEQFQKEFTPLFIKLNLINLEELSDKKKKIIFESWYRIGKERGGTCPV